VSEEMLTIHMQFSCTPFTLISYLYCKKIRPTSATQNEVTTLTKRLSNPNVQSIFVTTSCDPNCYVVQGWCTWSHTPNGLSLLMHQWATITKCSQFFLHALHQKTNHLHMEIPHLIETYSCQYIFVCYKIQHTGPSTMSGQSH